MSLFSTKTTKIGTPRKHLPLGPQRIMRQPARGIPGEGRWCHSSANKAKFSEMTDTFDFSAFVSTCCLKYVHNSNKSSCSILKPQRFRKFSSFRTKFIHPPFVLLYGDFQTSVS